MAKRCRRQPWRRPNEWCGKSLRRRKWDEGTLAARRKGDAVKVAIAERLRRETTVTLAWIAERMQMGAKTHLAHLLYWKRRNAK
jgi:hypothetical protein